MRCLRCGNGDKDLFFYINNKWVCRKCLMYKQTKENSNKYFKGDGNYTLKYKLTELQKEASLFVLNNIKNKKDCTLKAVTGSGKTEIIYESISYCVKNNLKIAIVIPRSDVVIELYQRIKNVFNTSSVEALYGGNTKKLYADILILTTHQLYRYENYFDVIIIDEVDAFPYKGNALLEHFLKRAVKGNIVYMSATILKNKTKENSYYLNKRYHGGKLDVPVIKCVMIKFWINKFLNKHKNDLVLMYFPTIKMQLAYSKKLKKKHYIINSKIKNRKSMLEKIHGLKRGLILTTLVLERGVTFKNCHVIVYQADHNLFSYENLIQISGRVGRNVDYRQGDILFVANRKTKTIKKAIKEIKEANE